ncbi:phosphopantetheine-binding protein [Streptomyces chromofuscus]|uniref:phosphopantetheine-binding protein n=1 Tax=Streptomyces chromofuscus TaxID=42881 RepID=UPI00167B4C05|nr:phosphopantetheine-binding protein [Streptomyces chromofuscus]GGT43310.1 hypothetical protein GCM10010254_73390 [Streptomyces chromofuscus]
MADSWDAQFVTIMRQVLRFLPDDEELTPDLDTAGLGLDSLASVELLISIEEAYGITIPDEFMVPATFATPGALWKVVSDQLNAGEAA